MCSACCAHEVPRQHPVSVTLQFNDISHASLSPVFPLICPPQSNPSFLRELQWFVTMLAPFLHCPLPCTTGGRLPVRPDTTPPPPFLDPPTHTSQHLVRTGNLGASGTQKICKTLDFPPLVYIQNGHNELGNAVPHVFFCWPGSLC